MLTQVTRAASLTGISLHRAEMDVRAYFPHGAKYDLPESRTACEILEYRLDLGTEASRQQVCKLARWAERACHVVNTFREPVDVLPTLRLNGTEIPLREWLGAPGGKVRL